MTIPANEVKKRGVSIFEELLQKWDEVILSVRGHKKYVVMDIDRYKKLRALELDKAYREVMEDIKNGDYHTDIDRHLKELEKEIENV